MHDVTGQVLSVSGRQAGRATIYGVAFSDGNEYTTFDGQIAGKAQGLVNQMVTARIDMKPKRDGDGHWLNLIDIAPAGAMPATMAPPIVPGTQIPSGTPVAGFSAPVTPSAAPVNIPMQPPKESDESRNRRITFLSAAGTAAQLIGSVYASSGADGREEAEEAFRKLTETIYTAAMGDARAAGATTPAPEPEAIAAAVPGVEVGANPGEPTPAATEGLPSW